MADFKAESLERGASFLDGLAESWADSQANEEIPPTDDTEREAWPTPEALPDDLGEVAAFDNRLLPESLRPWIADTAELLQCPPDFLAVPAVVALGAVIGRKVLIRPQAKTSWSAVSNVWGAIIGRPGTMKSPAVDEAMRPLRQLQARAREAYEEAMSVYGQEIEVAKLMQEAAKTAARKKLTAKVPGTITADDLKVDMPEAPILRRYTASNSTLEALGELLKQNPNGLMIERDEIASLLSHLAAEENAEARGFYLTGADGKSGYNFARIGRGLDNNIPSVCLSMMGTTQPGRIGAYLRQALTGGEGDDGMMQRFGLLVWPNQPATWRNVDRLPDTVARVRAQRVFENLDAMTADDVGAEEDDGERFLRFSPEALEHFVSWRTGFEESIRSGDLHPALESHFSKYRKTIPALALIFHLADGGTGPVSEQATIRALGWSDYLASHARRCYGAGQIAEVGAARRILERIRKGDLKEGFKAREIKRAAWSGLTDGPMVDRGLSMLCEYGWIAEAKIATGKMGGRPSASYAINPLGADHGMA